MKWLHKLLGSCEHNWNTFQTINHVWEDKTYYYTEYRQQCTKCGKIKSVNLNKPLFY